MKTKIKTIDIQAKEWFDKTYGNSYFAAKVTINFGMKGAETFTIPFQYGYGNHYEYIAFKELQKLGYIPEQKEMIPPWQYYRDNKIIVRTNKQENCKKRDLINI
jgi:hypothetical protein